MEMGGFWDEDGDSTASSDISDWTAEAGINFRTPSRKQPKRRMRYGGWVREEVPMLKSVLEPHT